GSNLNPRRRILHPHWRIPVPPGKPARPHTLERRHHRTKRVLPPTLQPLNNTIPENKPAPLINRIPPNKQASLLRRQLERRPVRMLKILRNPNRRPVIPQRPLRQNKLARPPPLPRRTNTDNINYRMRGDAGTSQDPSPPHHPHPAARSPNGHDDEKPPKSTNPPCQTEPP